MAGTTSTESRTTRIRPTDRIINLVLRLPTSILSRVRILWWRAVGVRIGKRCRLAAVEIPRNPWRIELENNVALDRGVVLLPTAGGREIGRIVIKSGCYINRHTMIDASECIEIGPHAMIGPGCYITDHDHGTKSGQPVKHQTLRGAPVHIGEDAWVGAHATILKGVTIGDGAIVGAGSVVTKSVPSGEIHAGVPARRIGKRE